jgi:pimeloyl-ACP methyl ester carboxylesterase
MQLDQIFLEGHSRFTADGIQERAFHFDVDSDQCFGLLYEPNQVTGMGFVVCHSYGIEFLTLRRIERAIARTLAAMGHPVLAFHGRGYGDSTGDLADATLARHLEDVRSAAEMLRAETGASQLGLIGGRFGSLMAGLMAREGDVDRLILFSPEFSGAKYFRRLIRGKHMVELTNQDGGHRRSLNDLIAELDAGGRLDLLGYALYGHLYRSLCEVDLAADVGRFDGGALVLQVSKRPSPSRDAEAFAALVDAGGGRTRLEVLKEPPGVTIGGPAFVSTTDPNVRKDLQEPLVAEMTKLVEEWMSK